MREIFPIGTTGAGRRASPGMTAGLAAALGALAGCGGEDGGGAASSTITGTSRSDELPGTAASNAINGLEGNDTITGGEGDDAIDGGEGRDIAAYADMRTGYRITELRQAGDVSSMYTVEDTDPGSEGDEGTDTLTDIESLRFGSGDTAVNIAIDNLVLDAIVGTVENDELNGGAGNQTITGGEGDDGIDGGEGYNTAAFAGSRNGYTIEWRHALDEGSIVRELVVTDTAADTNGDDGTDTLRNIDALRFGDVDTDPVAVDDLAWDAITGSSRADADLSGGPGDQTIAGGAGADTITGGAGDDMLHGHTADSVGVEVGVTDTAIYADARSGYAIAIRLVTLGEGDDAELNVPELTVTDIRTGDGGMDEGTDTLTGFEALRFGTGDGAETIGVVGVGTDETEILLGTAGHDAALDGMNGDDLIFGGAGDDIIDGGADDDTVIYAGARTDYRIWQDTGDGVTRTFVLDMTDSPGNDEGRDSLVGVEILRFQDIEMNLSDFGPDDFQGPVTAAAANLPTGMTVATGQRIMVDVAAWFDPAAGATVTYTATGLDDYSSLSLMTPDGAATISGDAPEDPATITIVVTASDIPDTTYDDVSHEYVITVTIVPLTGDEDSNTLNDTSNHGRTIQGLGGDDTITGGAGDDEIDGGAGDMDVGVYADVRAGYFITELRGAGATPDTYTVRDTNTEGDNADEGTDTLTGIESLRFGPAADNIPVQMLTPDAIVGASESENDLTGGEGSQTITGGAGDDVIDGGAGDDTAAFSGPRDGYTIERRHIPGGDQLVVADTDSQANGDDGMDTLTNIEFLRFGGGETDSVAVSDVELDTVTGGSQADDDLEGGTGDQTIIGGAGGDTITGGAGDDTLHGHTAESVADADDVTDTAVYADGPGGYDITAGSAQLGMGSTAETVVRFTVIDTDTDGDNTDEGTDTLTGFEAIRFGAVTLAVAVTGTDDAEIIAGSAEDTADTLNGLEGADLIFGIGGADNLDGGPGDDLIDGGAGDDILAGGGGDDIIIGGAGDDTATYGGDRNDYRIWRTGTGDALRTFVLHRDNSNSALGRDTLIGVETLRFGENDLTLSDEIRFDEAAISATVRAPASITATAGKPIVPQDIVPWFATAVGATVAYTVEGLDDYPTLSFEMTGGRATISGAAPRDAGPVTIMVTASDVDGETYDDITHTFVIAVENRPGPDSLIPTDEDDTLNDRTPFGRIITGRGGDDIITGGIGNDTLYGHTETELGPTSDRDAAVYAGPLADYRISAELHTHGSLPNIPRLTVRDTETASPTNAPNEGTDTLVGFEELRFDGAAEATFTVGPAGGGGDILFGEAMADTGDGAIDGMGGGDLIFGFGGDDTLMGGSGEDIISGGADSDTIGGGSDDDTIYGDSGADMLNGDAGDDTIYGGGDRDIIDGGGDDDTITGGAGNDEIDGGPGDDTAVFSGVVDDYSVTLIMGDASSYRITDDEPDNHGDDGRDTLAGIESARFSGGDSVLDIMVEDLELAGVEGTDGADTIDAGDGVQTIIGGDGDDTITGGAGGDTIDGDGDNDRITGGAGDDMIDGGAGANDTAVYERDIENFAFEAHATIATGMGGLIVTDLSTSGVTEEEGRDILEGIEMLEFGSPATSIVMADILIRNEGGATPVAIMGTDEANIIYGRGGGFTLTGGAGSDTFQFLEVADSGTDMMRSTISDFNMSEQDRIALGPNIGPVTVTRSDGDTVLTAGEFQLTLTNFSGALMEGTHYYHIGVAVDETPSNTVDTAPYAGTGMDDNINAGMATEAVSVTPGAGDDVIIGRASEAGEDTDTVIYAGSYRYFTIERDFHEPERFVVTDYNADDEGDEGRDELENIDVIQFNGDDPGVILNGENIHIGGPSDTNKNVNGGFDADFFHGKGGGFTYTGGPRADVFQFLSPTDSMNMTGRTTLIEDFESGEDKLRFSFGDADRFDVTMNVNIGSTEYTVIEDSESGFYLRLQSQATVDKDTDFEFVIPVAPASSGESPDGGDSAGFALRASRKKEIAVTGLEERGQGGTSNIVDFSANDDPSGMVADGGGSAWAPASDFPLTDPDEPDAVTSSFDACDDPCCCFQ